MADEILEQMNEKLVKAFDTYQNVQLHIAALADKTQEINLTELKVGTILTLAVCDRMAQGKNPKEFTNDDWKEISKLVDETVILASDQAYSEMVFEMYAQYIDISAEIYEEKLPEHIIESVRAKAVEIRHLGERLHNGEISEVDYTEECLWMCAESMFKLLFATKMLVFGEAAVALADAIATFSIAYGQYRMYSARLGELNSYLDYQYELDAALEADMDEYLNDLRASADEFNDLIDEAFDADFDCKLRNSVELARAAGVAEEDILETVDDIDDFFLN